MPDEEETVDLPASASDNYDDEGGVDLDFGGVQGREPFPDGTYILRVDGVPKKKPTKSGGEQISVMYRVVSRADGDETFKNKVVFDNWNFLPQSRWWMKSALEALTGEKWDKDNMKLRLSDLSGLRVKATVIIDGSYGPPKNKISTYFNEPVSDAPVGEDFKVPF